MVEAKLTRITTVTLPCQILTCVAIFKIKGKIAEDLNIFRIESDVQNSYIKRYVDV